MRFLKLCFVLMVFGSSAKAQEKETCCYHISFYKWEWNCSSTSCTIELAKTRGDSLSDSSARKNSNYLDSSVLKYPFEESFDSAYFEVITHDGRIKYEVIGFHILEIHRHHKDFEKEYEGKYLSKSALFDINNSKPKGGILIIKIKVLGLIADNEIELPSIKIYVK